MYDPVDSFSSTQTTTLRRTGGLLGGVAAGISRRTGMDLLVVRLIMLGLTIFTGPVAVAIYLAMWALVPGDGSARSFNPKILLGIVAVIALLSLGDIITFLPTSWLVIGAIVAFFYFRSKKK